MHDRMYNLASSKYEQSLHLSTDFSVLQGYAQSLCGYLKMQESPTTLSAISQGKEKVIAVIEDFCRRHNTDGIAEILKHMPLRGEYSELVCLAFNSIISVDQNYFAKERSLSRKDLIFIPKKFFLDDEFNPSEYQSTAARIYQEVVKESSLEYVYGEVQLKWITDLLSPQLIIAVVNSAMEDTNLNFIVAAKLFKNSNIDQVDITDHDIEVSSYTEFCSITSTQVLARNLPLTVGYDLSGCTQITKLSLAQIVRNRAVVAINLDGCRNLDDQSVLLLSHVAKQLELLSLAGLTEITDGGVIPIVSACSRLSVLNINHCSRLSQNTLFYAAQANKNIRTLHAAGVYINNEGLLSLCQLLSPDLFTSLDISLCREITDFSLITVARTFPRLTFINICGLSRVTGKGVRAICEMCWELRSINFEDLFLLNDSAFLFDQVDENRNEMNMLKSLTSVNLRDCVHLTDHGLLGLVERCQAIRELNLRGCDKITDKSLEFMSNNFKHSTSFSDHLAILDLSFCPKLSAGGISKLLEHCPILEELNVSGIATMSDKHMEEISVKCPTIVKLVAQRCLLLSNLALCSLARNLWITALDVSFCSKVSDEGIEIISLACTGLAHLSIRKLTKLTDKSLNVILENLRGLRTIDVSECPKISSNVGALFKRRGIKVQIG